MQFYAMLISGILLLTVVALHYYILQHFRSSMHMKGKSLKKPVVWGISAAMAATMLLCLASGSALPYLPWLQQGMGLLGAIMIGMMTTCLLLFPICDGIALILKTTKLQKATAIWRKIYAGGLSVLLIAVAITGYGIWNATVLHQTKYTISVEAYNGKPLSIAILSDIHEGSALRRDHLERIVAKTNAMYPDLVLICGDLFDENTAKAERTTAYQTLAKLQSEYGVFFVFGNHERNLNPDGAMRHALETAGITVLEDEIVTLAGLNIIGRKDASGNRAALDTLVAQADPNLPTLLMDHQPKDTAQAATLGVDLQVSGHTHGGQIFPGGWISEAVNEANYGLRRDEAYHLIVSSGCNLWGVPFRTEKHTEIVSVTLQSA